MISEENNNVSDKKNKIYSIASIVVIVVLSGLLTWVYFSTKEHKKSIDVLNQQLEASNQLKNIYSEILTAEEFVLEEHYQKAIEVYEAILPQLDPNDKVIISNRIGHLKKTLSNLKNTVLEESRKDSIIYQLKDSIDVLGKELNDLHQRFGSVSQVTNDQIAKLKKEIEIKERLLGQKENVQVISFNNENNRKIYYLGEVKNNKANGGGIGIWTSTGSVYRGEWKDNLRHGKGSFEWAEGERYEGEFNNDKREGHGIYYWPSGERYEGEWKESMRNGFGILYDPDGNIQFEGHWKDDKPINTK